MTHTDADVIVVGGGPAGAATAWSLARAGARVLVLDRAAFPRPKACAEYVSPEACRILDAMGVTARAEEAGAARLTGMRVCSPDGTELVGEFGTAHGRVSPYTAGIALRRERLDPLLLDAARAAGASVRERAHVVDVSRSSSRATSRRVDGVVLADGTTLRAPLVIGADGLRSVVARRIGVGARARWPRRVAFVTHYEGVAGMRAHGEMHVDTRGYLGLAPVDSGLVNVALVVPVRALRGDARGIAGNGAGAADGRPAHDAAHLVSDWIAQRPLLAARFAHATRRTPVRGTGPFAWHVRRAWAPGAALVGDAADFFDPFTGEGIYAALRGAELLTPHALAVCSAASPGAERTALAAYERARRAEFGGKWTVERLVGWAVSWPAFMNRAARGLAYRRDLADTFVGVTGDVVPARAVLRPGYLFALAQAALH